MPPGVATFAVIQREIDRYAGPHHVILRRGDSNSGGKSAHLNDVFPLASGRYLVSFDGDDVSDPNRVGRILAAFREDDSVTAVYSGYALMDQAGRYSTRRRVPTPLAGSRASMPMPRAPRWQCGATRSRSSVRWIRRFMRT